MAIVVDVSVAAKWFLPDERSDFADSVLDRVLHEGGYVPALFRWEIENVLLAAERANRLTVMEVDEALEVLRDAPITVESSSERLLAGSEVQLARHYDLTAYDAAYLTVAINQRLALATGDAELAYAARDLGIHVLSG